MSGSVITAPRHGRRRLLSDVSVVFGLLLGLVIVGVPLSRAQEPPSASSSLSSEDDSNEAASPTFATGIGAPAPLRGSNGVGNVREVKCDSSANIRGARLASVTTNSSSNITAWPSSNATESQVCQHSSALGQYRGKTRCICGQFFAGDLCELGPLKQPILVPLLGSHFVILLVLCGCGFVFSGSGLIWSCQLSRKSGTPFWSTSTLVITFCMIFSLFGLFHTYVTLVVLSDSYLPISRPIDWLWIILAEVGIVVNRLVFSAFELFWLTLAKNVRAFKPKSLLRLRWLVVFLAVFFTLSDIAWLSIQDSWGAFVWGASEIVAYLVSWALFFTLATLMRRWAGDNLPPATLSLIQLVTRLFLISYILMVPSAAAVIFFIIAPDELTFPLITMITWNIFSFFSCLSMLVRLYAVHPARRIGLWECHSQIIHNRAELPPPSQSAVVVPGASVGHTAQGDDSSSNSSHSEPATEMRTRDMDKPGGVSCLQFTAEPTKV